MTGKICSLLVANRGEIACRVMRTAKAMGIRTIAVYSEADAGAPHVAFADDAVLIGPAPASESYLNVGRMVEAAKASRADAIHPGYGFLSENAEFAEACAEAGIIFVGPPAQAIALMGNKAEAKRRMIKAGVPCVPGYEGRDQTDRSFAKAADDIGYPVMVKAAAGGGGRGMRLVDAASDLPDALKLARSEAENAFGSGELILEKAIVEPRHVEIQIFADDHGNVVHLGERDCSVQRRHQKVIEETPSPAVDGALRERMGAAAVKAAQSINYAGAGTVEFLLDGNGEFHFLEMNTRLQVEHPVTEMITGRDLVALQISVASGEPLGFSQNEVNFHGHAIEVRLYAENPDQDFLPSTGEIELWMPPEGQGVRVDSGIETGQMVSPFYDPMLAKIVAWGETRDRARRKLIKALGRTVLFGPETNRDFLISALTKPRFADGRATTAFIDAEFHDGPSGRDVNVEDAAIAAILRFIWSRDRLMARAGRVSSVLANWSSSASLSAHFELRADGRHFNLAVSARGEHYSAKIGDCVVEAGVERIAETDMRLRIGSRTVDVMFLVSGDKVFTSTADRTIEFTVVEPGSAAGDRGDFGGRVLAPMHGRIATVLVAEGDAIASGDKIAVLEAMKMQHQITSTAAGKVTAIHVSADSQVAADDLLIEIETEAESGAET